jgi:1-deoxy-D-xylulose-5-phosphate reductoisomerase
VTIQKICLLGASGSVGESTLKVIHQFKDNFVLHSCSVHANLQKAEQIIKEFSPQTMVITSEALRGVWGGKKYSTSILYGNEPLNDIVTDPAVDTVVTAVVGSLGIFPTLSAIKAGKKIAIANKETLVTFGPVINSLLQTHKTTLVPVDSEHNALFQLIHSQRPENIECITLTASGGPFRELPLDQFKNITLEKALNHPTWKMGQKITIDSAGMINKGLEVIEAHFLFGLAYSKIEVVIHPESIVHGAIELLDGSTLLYASQPDMVFPVAHSLFYPQPTPSVLKQRKPYSWNTLHFQEPDANRYPGLKLAYQAGISGGISPAVFNAANEEAVSWFLENKIHFTEIPHLIEYTLSAIPSQTSTVLEDFLEADKKARELVRNKIRG